MKNLRRRGAGNATRPRSENPSNFSSIACKTRDFSLLQTSRTFQRPIQPPVEWVSLLVALTGKVKRPGSEAAHSLLPTAEVKTTAAVRAHTHTHTHTCSFIACTEEPHLLPEYEGQTVY
jgi:hypothetical protein